MIQVFIYLASILTIISGISNANKTICNVREESVKAAEDETTDANEPFTKKISINGAIFRRKTEENNIRGPLDSPQREEKVNISNQRQSLDENAKINRHYPESSQRKETVENEHSKDSTTITETLQDEAKSKISDWCTRIYEKIAQKLPENSQKNLNRDEQVLRNKIGGYAKLRFKTAPRKIGNFSDQPLQASTNTHKSVWPMLSSRRHNMTNSPLKQSQKELNITNQVPKETQNTEKASKYRPQILHLNQRRFNPVNSDKSNWINTENQKMLNVSEQVSEDIANSSDSPEGQNHFHSTEIQPDWSTWISEKVQHSTKTHLPSKKSHMQIQSNQAAKENKDNSSNKSSVNLNQSINNNPLKSDWPIWKRPKYQTTEENNSEKSGTSTESQKVHSTPIKLDWPLWKRPKYQVKAKSAAVEDDCSDEVGGAGGFGCKVRKVDFTRGVDAQESKEAPAVTQGISTQPELTQPKPEVQASHPVYEYQVEESSSSNSDNPTIKTGEKKYSSKYRELEGITSESSQTPSEDVTENKTEMNTGEVGTAKNHKYSTKDENSDSDFKNHHDQHMVELGKKDDEDHEGDYEEDSGREDDHEDHADEDEAGEEHEEADSNQQHHQQDHNSMGHSTRGGQVVHEKDEYEKKTEFFDEDEDDGYGDKYGEYHDEHEAEDGGHKKEGQFKDSSTDNNQSKKSHNTEGVKNFEDRAKHLSSEHQNHHEHHQNNKKSLDERKEVAFGHMKKKGPVESSKASQSKEYDDSMVDPEEENEYSEVSDDADYNDSDGNHEKFSDNGSGGHDKEYNDGNDEEYNDSGNLGMVEEDNSGNDDNDENYDGEENNNNFTDGGKEKYMESLDGNYEDKQSETDLADEKYDLNKGQQTKPDINHSPYKVPGMPRNLQSPQIQYAYEEISSTGYRRPAVTSPQQFPVLQGHSPPRQLGRSGPTAGNYRHPPMTSSPKVQSRLSSISRTLEGRDGSIRHPDVTSHQQSSDHQQLISDRPRSSGEKSTRNDRHPAVTPKQHFPVVFHGLVSPKTRKADRDGPTTDFYHHSPRTDTYSYLGGNQNDVSAKYRAKNIPYVSKDIVTTQDSDKPTLGDSHKPGSDMPMRVHLDTGSWFPRSYPVLPATGKARYIRYPNAEDTKFQEDLSKATAGGKSYSNLQQQQQTVERPTYRITTSFQPISISTGPAKMAFN